MQQLGWTQKYQRSVEHSLNDDENFNVDHILLDIVSAQYQNDQRRVELMDAICKLKEYSLRLMSVSTTNELDDYGPIIGHCRLR